jgi:hypothetical protein
VAQTPVVPSFPTEGKLGQPQLDGDGKGGPTQQTKLTHIGNEPMESAKNSGQLEGWNQILDKVAAVVAKLAQAK